MIATTSLNAAKTRAWLRRAKRSRLLISLHDFAVDKRREAAESIKRFCLKHITPLRLSRCATRCRRKPLLFID